MSTDYDYLLKTVVVGDSGSGKTSLIERYVNGVFMERHICTIGVDFSLKTGVHDSFRYKMQIWDTAGQERFRSITRTFYRGANCIVVVYDASQADSVKTVQTWLDEIDQLMGPESRVPVLVVGNKADLARTLPDGSTRTSAVVQMQPWMVDRKVQWLETSAKDGRNVDQVFAAAVATSLQQLHLNRGAVDPRRSRDSAADGPAASFLPSRTCTLKTGSDSKKKKGIFSWCFVL